MKPRYATTEEIEGAVRRFGAARAARALWAHGLLAPIAGASGLAIDSSTPAPTTVTETGGGASTTTASFTPPSGSVIVVFATTLNTTSAQSMTISDSGGLLTWSRISGAQAQGQVYTGYYADTEAWYAVGTGAAISVEGAWSPSINWTSGNLGILAPIVFTGAATTQAGATATVIRGNCTGAVTTTAAGSWVFAAGITADGNTAPTIGGSQTDTINANSMVVTGSSFNGAYWVQMQDSTTTASGTNVTMSATTSGSDNNFLVVEILASGAGPTPNPQIASGFFAA